LVTILKVLRSINTSAAIIVLACFFMPWVQVSCAGARDTMTGIDLARNGHGLLWFIPVLMGALVLSNIIRVRRDQNRALSLASAMSGLITAYLMNGERLRAHDESGLISAQLTGWFWLGFMSALAVALSGLWMLLKRQRAP
jgi:hypothetical protein